MSFANDFKVSGTITYIDNERPSKEGSTFMLRDFAIEQAVMGESNYIKCQLKGNNTSKIDGYFPGDEVIISFALLGSVKVKEDKVKCATNQTGLDGFSPNVNVWKIEFATGFQRSGNQSTYTQQANQTKANTTQTSASATNTSSTPVTKFVLNGVEYDLKNASVPIPDFIWNTEKSIWEADLPF